MFILRYMYICKFKKWVLSFISVCALLLIIIQTLRPSVIQLAELHKCPACYGISACHNIHKISLSWHDINAVFSHLFGVKNLFFGVYERNKVVLKKLAHLSELKMLDTTFCNIFHLNYPCSNISKQNLNRHSADFYNLIKKTITVNFSKDDTSRLRLCPTIQHLDDLFNNVHLNNKHIDPVQYLINIWTLISINPEPIILQVNFK